MEFFQFLFACFFIGNVIMNGLEGRFGHIEVWTYRIWIYAVILMLCGIVGLAI